MAKEAKRLGPIRIKTCGTCSGWGFVPERYPMEFCPECVKPTVHREFRPPEGVRLIHTEGVVPRKEKQARDEQVLRSRQR